MTPRKHADLIKAWADGAEIEIYSECNKVWSFISMPIWHFGQQYRVKPEPKPNIVFEGYTSISNIGEPQIQFSIYESSEIYNIRFEFDGATNKLVKVEMI